MQNRSLALPLGVVLRRTPGVTRWAKWEWKAVAVLPGARDETWRELRRDGDAVEYHAATVPLELWRSDTEAYMTELSTRSPSIYVVMRVPTDKEATHPLDVVLATASPYDAQDYADNGEDIVELVPMSDGLIALIQGFITEHHKEEKFVKRKRDNRRVDLVEDGVGDARINQLTDVYRAPGSKSGVVH